MLHSRNLLGLLVVLVIGRAPAFAWEKDKSPQHEKIVGFIRDVHSKDYNVLSRALYSTLKEIGPQDKDAVPLLLEAMQRSDADVDSLLQALTRIGPVAVPSLVRAADESTEVSERVGAVRAIGSIRSDAEASIACLIRALSDESPIVRRASAKSVGRLGEHAKPAVFALIKALDDTNEHVRLEVLETFARLGPISEPAVPKLIALLPVSERTVRRHALLALAKVGANAADAVPAIIDLMRSKDRGLREFAAHALRNIAPDRAAELLGDRFDPVRARFVANQGLRVGKHDWPQLGGSRLRNNTPQGPGIPTTWHPGEFDRRTGEWLREKAVNIKWIAQLGSQSYGHLVVANGKVYAGTNNSAAHLKRHPATRDLGCLLCFRESDGKFLWQHSSEKLPTGRVHDWPLQGICSSPLVDGDRLWFVTSRAEVRCLDTEGFYDNQDDGPVKEVSAHLFSATPSLHPDFHRAAKSFIRSPYIDTFRAVLKRRTDIPAPTPYTFALRKTSPSGKWRVQSCGSPDLDLAVQGDRLLINNVEQGGRRPLSVQMNLLAGLDDGTLTPELRDVCSFHDIQVPAGAKSRVITPGKSWIIPAQVGGVRRDVRLTVEDKLLRCEQLIAPPEKFDADVVWTFDMMNQLGVSQHNMANCAPTAWGDVLFICTSNGVDSSHVTLPAPNAPSFIALNKHTGELLWTDNSPGANVLHGQWSSPTVGVFEGLPQVIFAGGDGWLYSFRADRWKDKKPELLWKFDCNPKASQWILGGRGTRNNAIAVPVIYDGLIYQAVGQDPEHGEGDGHLWCIDPARRGDVSPELVVDGKGEIVPHRRHQAFQEWAELFKTRLELRDGLDEGKISRVLRQEFENASVRLPKNVRISVQQQGQQWIASGKIDDKQVVFRLRVGSVHRGQGDEEMLIVERRTAEKVVANPNSAVVWHYAGCDQNGDGKWEFEEAMHRTIASPVIKNDILVIPDFSGLVHCLHAKTGTAYWTCDLLASCWCSPLIVGDQVYVADEDGDVAIFPLSSDPGGSIDGDGFPTREVNMDNSVYTTPVVANNVLYIMNRTRLYAIERQPQ